MLIQKTVVRIKFSDYLLCAASLNLSLIKSLLFINICTYFMLKDGFQTEKTYGVFWLNFKVHYLHFCLGNLTPHVFDGFLKNTACLLIGKEGGSSVFP